MNCPDDVPNEFRTVVGQDTCLHKSVQNKLIRTLDVVRIPAVFFLMPVDNQDDPLVIVLLEVSLALSDPDALSDLSLCVLLHLVPCIGIASVLGDDLIQGWKLARYLEPPDGFKWFQFCSFPREPPEVPLCVKGVVTV